MPGVNLGGDAGSHRGSEEVRKEREGTNGVLAMQSPRWAPEAGFAWGLLGVWLGHPHRRRQGPAV